MSTITITFSESVENHVGNQQIGEIADCGISYEKLKQIQKKLEKKYPCKFINLKSFLDHEDKNDVLDAGVLIVKNFINIFYTQCFIHVSVHFISIMNTRIRCSKLHFSLC